MHFLPYLLLRLRHPASRQYLDQGAGIEARHNRCKVFWKKHLEFCKQFQRAACSKASGRVAVLGAGRLLDVDIEFLLSHFEEVVLFDADPGCVATWRRSKRRSSNLHWQLRDLTGVMEEWTNRLSSARTLSEAAHVLEALPPPRPIDSGTFDVVISLNLLSQLGVYWRDRLAIILERKGLLDPRAQQFPEPILSAYRRTKSALEDAHLSLVTAMEVTDAIVISDVLFFFYTRDQALWDCEAALEAIPEKLPHYELKTRDAWLWHVAPQGLEDPDFGAIHEVRAWHFVSSGSGASEGGSRP